MKKTLILLTMFVTGFVQAQQTTPSTTTTTTTTTGTPAAPAKADTVFIQPVPVVVPVDTLKKDTVGLVQPVQPVEPVQTVQPKEETTLLKGYIGGRVLATVTDLEFSNSNNGALTTEIVWGYGIGGYGGFNFSKNFALQLEVLYQSLAQRVQNENSDITLKLRYLNIPLLLVYNTNINKPVNFNVCFGPQIGIRIGSDVEQSSGSGSVEDTLQAVVAVKPGDLGIAYGAGFDFRLSDAVKLGLGFRGVVGIIDIDENSNNTTSGNYYVLDRSKLRTYSGYLGIRYSF